MRRSAAVAVTSEDYARHSRMWPSIAPAMHVVPPPCPAPPPGRPNYRETDGPHIGFLGRIVREKGLEHLVRGFRALPDPDARLLIGGDYSHVAGGSVVSQVRAAIGDDPRVRLLGFVPEERLGDFYASLDVFTLPSVNAFEAFGIVQAVAMLAGVPVLSSDIPGVRQPVVQTGFGTLVPPGDEAAITRGLQELYTNPPDRTRGIARASRAFSVANVLDTYEVLLDKAALGRATGEPTDRTGPTTTGRTARRATVPRCAGTSGWCAATAGPGPTWTSAAVPGTCSGGSRRTDRGGPRGLGVVGGDRPRTAPGAHVYDDPDALPDAGFGALVAVHVLEHLDDAAVAATLATWRRVLVPGGRALVATPDPAGRGHAISGGGGSGTPTRRTSISGRTPTGGTCWPTTGSACCTRPATGCGTCPTAVGTARETSSGRLRRWRSTSPGG